VTRNTEEVGNRGEDGNEPRNVNSLRL